MVLEIQQSQRFDAPPKLAQYYTVQFNVFLVFVATGFPSLCFTYNLTKKITEKVAVISFLICLHPSWRAPFWRLLSVRCWGRGPGTPVSVSCNQKNEDRLRRP